MNGRTHAAIGAASMTGAALAGVPPVECAVMTVIAAGFALGPDIDHPESTISKTMPKVVHHIAHIGSKTVRVATSTKADRKHFTWKIDHGHDPDHRTLTHTIVSTAVIGTTVFFLAALTWTVVALTVLAIWWCHRLTKGLMFLAVPIALLPILHGPIDPLLVTWAATAGWLSHILADACTKSGVPLMWPLKVKGKRWYRVRFLGSSLASGDPREWLAGFMIALVMNGHLLML